MTTTQLEELSYSTAYAEFLMTCGDVLICNGNMLIELQESLYMFDEFLATL